VKNKLGDVGKVQAKSVAVQALPRSGSFNKVAAELTVEGKIDDDMVIKEL